MSQVVLALYAEGSADIHFLPQIIRRWQIPMPYAQC
jgi:hypothetical protein